MKTSQSLSALALSLAVVFTAQAEDSATPVAPAFIERLVKEAVTTHPSVEAAQARAQAAASAIGALRLWEDPQLGLGTLFASQMNRQGQGDIVTGIEQMLPRPKLYQAEKRRAIAEQQVQQATKRQTANEIALAVAQSVLELALADEVVNLQSENLGWLQTIVKTAEERAKSPDATATETLRLESELAVQTQTVEAAKRQRTLYATTLNLLMGRATNSAWQRLSLPMKVPELTSTAALKARLEHDNPKLAALRHQVAGAQAETDAAKEKRKPAFSVGVQVNAYSAGSSHDAMTMFTVGMNLPWFNRSAYRADIARAESMRAAAQGDLAAEQRKLYTQFTLLMTEAENNRRLAAAYTSEVLPKTEKTVETLQNAWVSSKATLLEVLEARRALLQARQEQKRALAAQTVAAQALSALTGSLVKPSSR
ncbi:TolC family protein [Prosthecobacter dejongeii]|uniref:Outer membrane protein TolC n=1 Tax=Prosthecobacter dejongeii TaxID=48465 RepID=A0A7W8DNX0_9BACT|nr:TolC family protein [Prosthecobacter dejongeii]MBB5036366.1 outer membrane protein TolC [Prosthecobacter dejongeii]